MEARRYVGGLTGEVEREVIVVVVVAWAAFGLVTLDISIASMRALASMSETSRDSTVEFPSSGSARRAFR